MSSAERSRSADVPEVSAKAARPVTRRYISIAEAGEYLGISTKFVRNLIVEGEIKGYRIGSAARHRTLRVDLDEIDEMLMQPVGAYWNDRSAKPRRRSSNKPAPDRSVAVSRIDPLDKTFYRFCNCGHSGRDHFSGGRFGDTHGEGPCHAPTWENIPGQLSRDTGPCTCKGFDEDIKRRRRKPKKYQE
jgi:excisionase family DNA binding protein